MKRKKERKEGKEKQGCEAQFARRIRILTYLPYRRSCRVNTTVLASAVAMLEFRWKCQIRDHPKQDVTKDTIPFSPSCVNDSASYRVPYNTYNEL